MHPGLEFAERSRGGVFTVEDARRAGLRPDQIRSAVVSGAWRPLRRGIYVTSERWAAARDVRARHLLAAAAALTALDPGPVLSHTSAARFHELVLPRRVDDVVRLTHPDQWRSGRGYRIAAAALPPEDLVVADALRATSVARTLLDCAREWSLTDAVVAIDSAMQTRKCRRADLTDAVLRQSHWRGIGAAARAVGLSDGRAESPLETRGRLAMLATGLPAPELQVELHGPQGFVGRVDAWFEEAAVAVEFDGEVKYTDPWGGRTPAEVAWVEKRREDHVRDLDVRVVRVVQEDLPRFERVAGRIDELLRRPFTGPRRFRVVRTPEPGSDPAGAVA
ncbi:MULTISPECIES: type IV toxin-antitoxin system AbiEi family antitoxin domain-containing protein [unclassified Blastococcus]